MYFCGILLVQSVFQCFTYSSGSPEDAEKEDEDGTDEDELQCESFVVFSRFLGCVYEPLL